jgi:hypothetical protein
VPGQLFKCELPNRVISGEYTLGQLERLAADLAAFGNWWMLKSRSNADKKAGGSRMIYHEPSFLLIRSAPCGRQW